MFMGYPKPTPSPAGKNSKGRTIKLKPMSLKVSHSIYHSAAAMFAACDARGSLPGTHCRMNGFDKEGSQFHSPIKNAEFSYVPRAESKPYWDMAHEFVLADRMFSSQLDESFVAHQYVIAAQSQSSVDVPRGEWGCEGGAGDTVQTITKLRSTGRLSRPASIIRRSATSWTEPAYRGGSTRANITRRRSAACGPAIRQ